MCLSLFSSKQCIIKQLLDSVFGDILNNQGLGQCYQPEVSAWLITLTSTLINPDADHRNRPHPIIVTYVLLTICAVCCCYRRIG